MGSSAVCLIKDVQVQLKVRRTLSSVGTSSSNNNMNQLIERDRLDLTMDKTTWPNSSYANVQGRLNGKKTDKGGQHVLF